MIRGVFIKQGIDVMIELSYPPSVLNPNNTAYWTKKAKAKKAYRKEAYWVAKMGDIPSQFNFVIKFHPPTKHKRDLDNAIAAFKSGQDGLADAWGVDDSIFSFAYEFGDVVKGGKVVIQELK